MDRLMSEQAIVDVLRKGYWDKNLQSAKDDPCVIDAMIDWAIRQIKTIPSAEPYKGMTNGQVHDMLYQMLVELKDGADRYGAEKWWNSPYEPQEKDVTRLLSLEQEPCEDAISREDVIALVQCSEYELQDRVDNDAMCDDVRKLRPVKPQPCEDAISRQAVLDIVKSSKLNWIVFKRVNDLPSVNLQEVTGHWVTQDIHNCHTDFKCSECGYIHNFTHLYGEPTADYTYCPNCGARMVEEQKRSE